MFIRQAQRTVSSWVCRTFGDACLASKKERALRALEECVEAIQGQLTINEIQSVVDQVYSKPVETNMKREIGASIITMLAYAESIGIDAENAVEDELEYIETNTDKIKTSHAVKVARGTGIHFGG